MPELTPDQNATARPTDVPAAKIQGQIRDLDGATYTFRPASVDQLDRYLSTVKNKTVSASITLALDMVEPEQRNQLAAALEDKPGLALRVVNAELEAKGFAGQD